MLPRVIGRVGCRGGEHRASAGARHLGQRCRCVPCPQRASKRRLVAGGIPDEKVILKPNFVDDPGPRANRPQSPNRSCSLGASPRRRESSSCSRRGGAPRPGSPLARHRRRPADVRSTRPPRREHPSAGPAAEGRGQAADAVQQGARAAVARVRGPAPCSVGGVGRGAPRARLGPRREPGSARCPGAEWLVAPGRVEDWSRALSRLARGSIVDQAGARARSTYCKRFTPEVGLRNLERAYTSALDV